MVAIRHPASLALAFAAVLLSGGTCAAPWIGVDWAGRKPAFPAGSLYWHTGKYRTCPVVFRSVIQVKDQPVAWAGFLARARPYAYAFLNGRLVASRREIDTDTEFFAVELGHLLLPGRNVLAISTAPEGMAVEGYIRYEGGDTQRFGTDARGWKANKFEPLTLLEDEPFMRDDFDDGAWFSVKPSERPSVDVSLETFEGMCRELEGKRLARWDEDGEWRLRMLGEKGIAVVDWEPHGWGGAERLPAWVKSLAGPIGAPGPSSPGSTHLRAEALTRYVVLSDEAVNMENLAKGLGILRAPGEDTLACTRASRSLREALGKMEQALKAREYGEALVHARHAEAARDAVRRGRHLNRLNRALDNKFSWFDAGALMDNNPGDWGLQVASPAAIFRSPLSPAAMVTLREKELRIQGWAGLKPLRVYKKPPVIGPVCLWAVLGGKVTRLRPGPDGSVYDRRRDGELGENWVLLVDDLSRGGHLPVELVFLNPPGRIVFQAGERGTEEVVATFDEPGARLFILRPLKEWRGFLQQARVMTADPLNEEQVRRYIHPCRFWSRALLNYPVTFSEAFVPDAEDPWALTVADVYNYWELEDAWGTRPLRIAPLPPLATYGLMTGYPGLRVVGPSEVVGSRGIWGDHVAAVDRDHIVYRVPLDPMKRFGGFTSYCFGPTDIGEPGGRKEIETIRRTGANTFRPQHNNSGKRAIQTVRWCLDEGLQNVFNADEKWIPDIVEHYRTLAEACKDFPPDTVAYDLLNEPETRGPRAYAALVKKITAAIRKVDRTHIIYVEAMPPWGPGAQPFPEGAFETLESTGDERTVYSFHDYEFRLPPRWPNEKHDIRDILDRWIPPLRFAIDHRVAIHLGEFGGFEQTKQSVFENPCALTMMMDYLRVFDQFGWHWHYYANRGVTRVRRDGSLQESYVQQAYRRYFAGGTFNLHRSR